MLLQCYRCEEKTEHSVTADVYDEFENEKPPEVSVMVVGRCDECYWPNYEGLCRLPIFFEE